MSHYNSCIAWVFTLNNPEGQLDPDTMPDLRFMVWQEERGQSGTHHYQGYLELTKKKRLGGVRTLISRAHFEPRRGTREQAIAYCKKEDSRIRGPWEWGESIEKGHRSDLKKAYQMIKRGATEQELMEEDFGMWARNYRAFVRAKRLLLPPRDHKTKIIVLFGITDSGKSMWCRKTFPDAFWKPRGLWWCGYEQQEVVVIDDFYGWLPFDFMLRLLDRYPLTVETKGGSEVFTSKIICITSNSPPDKWYDFPKNPNMVFAALDRRLDVIVEYRGVFGVNDKMIPSSISIDVLRGDLDSYSGGSMGKISIISDESTSSSQSEACENIMEE